MKRFKKLLKKKTFWTGVAMVVAAAGAYSTGDADAFTAAESGLLGLGLIFGRAAAVKIEEGLERP
jgi:hypothetical protein